MKFFKRIFASFVISLVLIFYGLPSASANQSGDIVWKQYILPPVNIVEGTFAGKGYAQRIVGDIAKHLPKYNHVLQYGTFANIFSDLQSRPGLCALCLKKTKEREKFLIYSKPVYVFIEATLAVRSQSTALVDGFVDKNNQVDLDALWRKSDLAFGFYPGRRYNPVINDFISSYRDYTPDRFWGHDSPLMLLDGRRVAAAFLHPQESRFGILENSYALSLKFYGIKGSSPLALAYVACAQSKWGKRVIRQINRILKTTNIHEKGIGYYSEWLTDDTRRWYSSRAKKLLHP